MMAWLKQIPISEIIYFGKFGIPGISQSKTGKKSKTKKNILGMGIEFSEEGLEV